jgi:hypothetical protein
MWVGAAAMMLDFPEYRGYGQGYFEKERQFNEFIEGYEYHPLEMLRTSRLITVGINACLLGIIYWLIRRLFGWLVAFVGVLFLSFEPFLLGHTRILAHEGMMSLLLLVSLLAFINFLYQGRNWLFLLLSAISAALAVLTKSSATIIVPFIGLLCLIEAIQVGRKQSGGWTEMILHQGKRLGGAYLIWIVVFLLAFVVFWPGMWVNPGKMLFEVYGNAFSYAIQGSNLESVETGDSPSIRLLDTDFKEYTKNLFWRTTPALWIGLLSAIFVLFTKKELWPPNSKACILTILGFGMIFYLMMAIARGRDASHYIMTTYACLSLVAGLGFAFGITGIWQLGSGKMRYLVPVFIGLLALKIVSVISYYPYYFNYSNPILELIEDGVQTPVSGYGEGLELAAAYLEEKTATDQITVLSWWGIGPFSYFFSGQTRNIFPDSGWPPAMVERLEAADYLVVYYYHQQRRNMPSKLLRELEGVTPEHTIWMNGVEYVRIYRVDDLPESVYIPDVQENP